MDSTFQYKRHCVRIIRGLTIELSIDDEDFTDCLLNQRTYPPAEFAKFVIDSWEASSIAKPPCQDVPQLDSIQSVEAAIWRELGSDDPQSAEALRQALADAVSRWLLSRSQTPEIDALKLLCRVKANIARPDRLLDRRHARPES